MFIIESVWDIYTFISELTGDAATAFSSKGETTDIIIFFEICMSSSASNIILSPDF